VSKKVYVIEWGEYEEGWGPRHDSYSIHTDEEKMLEFMKEYSKPSEMHSYMPLKRYVVKDDRLYMKAKRAGGSTTVYSLA